MTPKNSSSSYWSTGYKHFRQILRKLQRTKILYSLEILKCSRLIYFPLYSTDLLSILKTLQPSLQVESFIFQSLTANHIYVSHFFVLSNTTDIKFLFRSAETYQPNQIPDPFHRPLNKFSITHSNPYTVINSVMKHFLINFSFVYQKYL